MPSNIEIKAKINDLQALKQKAADLSGTDATILIQEDTFFNTPNGRLKLRQEGSKNSQLIFYNRPDQKGPKFSDYYVTLIEDAESLKVTLDKAYGIKGIVKKTRYLYVVGQTRVHVDDVENLGAFMELEVQMKPDQEISEGQRIAEELMEKLGIEENSLITGAYMDLLLK